MLVKTANGYYMPSFFFINIDSEENLDSIIANNQQTFVHEYIHFLQDLVLPYCIRANMSIKNRLGSINEYALRFKEVTRPFTEWNKDCNITNWQAAYTWGDSQFLHPVNTVKGIQRDYFTIPTGQNVYRYILDTDTAKYQVGARDFLEYIAHKIESKHWQINTYNFPYKTVDKLFEYYGLSDIPTEVRICVVEYCLYNDNPIHLFIEQFINKGFINNNKNLFMSYANCKELLLSHGWTARGGFKESIFSKTERRLNDFNKFLSNQYKHVQFSEIKKWIDHVNEYAKSNLSNKFIFSELYNMNYEEFINNINKIVEDIGIPLIFNKKQECACMLPKGYEPVPFTQFYVMLGFLEYMTSDSNECPVAAYCKSNDMAMYKEDCLKDPFSVNKEELCPFSLFTKSYGFDSAVIKKSL